MTSLNFWKMQGAGNDFVVLDTLGDAIPVDFDFSEAAKVLCARGFGIGGDGLLSLEAPTPEARQQGAAIRMRMWNPDGSEDMCGNGLRCIVRLALELKHVAGMQFTTETIAGLRSCEVLSAQEVRVGMGEPQFARKDIPMQSNARGEASAIEYALQSDGIALGTFSSVSTGSTHTVAFIDEPIADEYFGTHSPLIENHPIFPERTSVMWAQVVGPNRLKLRIWERGVGETLACGTGACAAVIIAQVTARCVPEENGIAVESGGGTLNVKWQPGREILLSGPAQIVYRGVWNL